MGISVNSGWASYDAANRITSYNSKLANSVGKITNGMRINSAADDPAGIVSAEKMRDRIGATDQANVNAQNAQALLKTADSTFSQTIDVLQRMKELAVQGTDQTLEADGLTAIQNEYATLNSRLATIATGAKYGGLEIFNAESSSEGNKTLLGDGLTFLLGPDADTSVAVSLGDDLTAVGLGSIAEFSTDDLASNITAVQTALDNAVAAQGRLGAYENAFGYINEGLEMDSTSLQSSFETAFDTDTAREMTSYVKNSVLLQASQLILSQQNQNAYSTLNLLSH